MSFPRVIYKTLPVMLALTSAVPALADEQAAAPATESAPAARVDSCAGVRLSGLIRITSLKAVEEMGEKSWLVQSSPAIRLEPRTPGLSVLVGADRPLLESMGEKSPVSLLGTLELEGSGGACKAIVSWAPIWAPLPNGEYAIKADPLSANSAGLVLTDTRSSEAYVLSFED